MLILIPVFGVAFTKNATTLFFGRRSLPLGLRRGSTFLMRMHFFLPLCIAAVNNQPHFLVVFLRIIHVELGREIAFVVKK